MISKQFLYYSTKEEFLVDSGYKNNPNQEPNLDTYGEIYGSSIAYIADSKEIWTHGVFYKCDISASEVEDLVNKGTIDPATLAPIVAGTASVGSSKKYAREDHVHPAQTSVSGNAGTATKLSSNRTFALTGAVTGSVTSDLSSGVSISTTLSNIDASKINSGTIDIDRLPKGALERLAIVENQSARFSLTTNDVQEGDTVKQSDTGMLYFVVDSTKLNSEDGYSVYTAGSATSVPWSGVTGKPTFASIATSGDYNDLINAPSLNGYATESWVREQGFLNTITKSQVESVLTGNITTHTHNQYLTSHQPLNHLNVADKRDTTTLPSDNTRASASFWFNMNGTPSNNWYSGLSVTGWSTDYCSWEICANSADEPTINDHLYFRTGYRDSWLEWKSLAFTSDITWSALIDKPTTLTGYGITDAVTLNTDQTINGVKTFTSEIKTSNIDGAYHVGAVRAAIMYNDDIPITRDRAAWFYNMKSSSGHTIAFGGLNDRIGFYTFLSDRTENGFDSSFECDIPTNTWIASNAVKAEKFIKKGGKASQFLKADGSVDENSYLTTEALDGYATKTELDGYLPLSGGTMDLGAEIQFRSEDPYEGSERITSIGMDGRDFYINSLYSLWIGCSPYNPNNYPTVYIGGENIWVDDTGFYCNDIYTRCIMPYEGTGIGFYWDGSAPLYTLEENGYFNIEALGAQKIYREGQPYSVGSSTTPVYLSNGLFWECSLPVTNLQMATLTDTTVNAGYSYNNTGISKTITTLNGFSETNQNAVIISDTKLAFSATNAIKMKGLDNLSGKYYIYCLSYMANGKVAINCAVYE